MNLPDTLLNALKHLNIPPLQVSGTRSGLNTFYTLTDQPHPLAILNTRGTLYLYTARAQPTMHIDSGPAAVMNTEHHRVSPLHTFDVLASLHWTAHIHGSQAQPASLTGASNLLTDRWVLRHTDGHTSLPLDLTRLNSGILAPGQPNTLPTHGPLALLLGDPNKGPPERAWGLVHCGYGMINLTALEQLQQLTTRRALTG